MLSLKKLQFNNIGRFVEEQEIDFSDFEKISQIKGLNKNTGGSSGAAKSTVFHAIDYLLGINDIAATSLQSRLTKSDMYVTGIFDVKGIELTISRSKKDGLAITYGDETVSGNVKLAEERLDEIIGIPKKLFKKMVHKKQGEGGFFLNLTAKESYDFLMNALGLDSVGKKTAKIDENIKEINSRINQLDIALNSFSSSVDEIEQMMAFEKAPTALSDDYNEDSIAKLINTNNSYKELLKNLESDFLSEVKDLESKKPQRKSVASMPEDDAEISKINTAISELKKKKQDAILDNLNKKNLVSRQIDDIKSSLSKMSYIRSNIERNAQDMRKILIEKKHIEESKCPTCSQHWSGEEASNKIKSMDISISELRTKIVSDSNTVSKEPELKEALDRLNQEMSIIESNNDFSQIDNEISEKTQKLLLIKSNRDNANQKLENEFLTEFNLFSQKLESIKTNYTAKINPIKQAIQETSETIKLRQQALNNYKLSMTVHLEKMERMAKNLEEKTANMNSCIEQKGAKNKELLVASETKRLIKTYTLQIFQDTLDYIGTYATDILSNIPNMANATIYFEGCKENKSGTIKDEVTAIINLDGYDNVNIKTLSGGERTAVDLAVDLAVVDMIESKAGMGADFFILDEPFSGLEEINISQCLEVLKQVDTNKKIIIVDHNPIVKEMVPESISIERDGEFSVVI